MRLLLGWDGVGRRYVILLELDLAGAARSLCCYMGIIVCKMMLLETS